jgi:REP element-mobilizing transposase RayT
MNAPIHHRHSTRLADYDYSQNGAYFVTLCTWQHKEIFGKIIAGAMQLNDWGEIVEQTWLRANHGFPNVSMDTFIIMPNHIHGVIVIDHPGATRVGSENETPETGWVAPTRPAGPHKGSLGAIIGQFKSRASKQITAAGGQISVSPGKVWQRNYYEHIIRSELEWDRVRKYIDTNPMIWHLDDENPDRTDQRIPPTR